MDKRFDSKSKGRFSPAMLAVAGLALAVPGAGLAVASPGITEAAQPVEFLPFTPAGADPELAQKVARLVGEDALRFTPASKPVPQRDRTVNFAVRVDDATARTLSGRTSLEPLAATSAVQTALPVAPTRYNLGIARGYQSFAQPTRSVTAAAVAEGLKDIAMPDLGTFDSKEQDGKPSRFQSRIALEQEGLAGSTPRTLEGAGRQRVDLGGSYRLSRNLDVTAGVRIKQDRDRLGPLTDGMEDDQAVYVGTQIRF
ncbi:hypothetical protein [Erythrobacter sp. SD-21]|uniref:hypothetical protein n=1 Tax=Erythrobacter sp. SD-21 TaxID=161528 RepID=UPI000153F85F|nr:hypothetical protein [Erythrobacter sp. SD-21]EDL49643.1 hypothetical protein ED21_18632 [Erythrobacter sp. SD-21]